MCVQIILLDFQLVENQEEINLCAPACKASLLAGRSAPPRETHFSEQSHFALGPPHIF
jgi:hypothetical protein